MNSYNLEEIQSKLNSLHPKQIVNTIGEFKISLFEVTYSYTTIRNNKKKGVKYFIVDKLNPNYSITQEFNSWVEEYNKENIHRQISNVKILGSQCIGYINI